MEKHYNGKTKDDSASTLNEPSFTLRGGEARIKYVENVNGTFHALFGSTKNMLTKKMQIITFTLFVLQR